MKQKEILEFIQQNVLILQKKRDSEEKTNLPETSKEYTKGQLYEAAYILEKVEDIIFRD